MKDTHHFQIVDQSPMMVWRRFGTDRESKSHTWLLYTHLVPLTPWHAIAASPKSQRFLYNLETLRTNYWGNLFVQDFKSDTLSRNQISRNIQCSFALVLQQRQEAQLIGKRRYLHETRSATLHHRRSQCPSRAVPSHASRSRLSRSQVVRTQSNGHPDTPAYNKVVRAVYDKNTYRKCPWTVSYLSNKVSKEATPAPNECPHTTRL